MQPPPLLDASGSWQELVVGPRVGELERLLPEYLRGRRWFGHKTERIASASLAGAVSLPGESGAILTIVAVALGGGKRTLYQLPLLLTSGEAAREVLAARPHLVVARVGDDLLCDATASASFATDLLEGLARGLNLPTAVGALSASTRPRFVEVYAGGRALTPQLGTAEQTNTAILYGKRAFAKLYRRVEEGVNPDLEVSCYLTEVAGFAHTPPVLGVWELARETRPSTTLLILQEQVANQGDAWAQALTLIRAGDGPAFTPFAALLGKRTAELHAALAQPAADERFQPEPFAPADQQALAGGVATLLTRSLAELRSECPAFATATRKLADEVLASEGLIRRRIAAFRQAAVGGLRTRVHGDYHLGQVLFTGSDYAIIDFEGEPTRPLAERCRKHSPLKDVAGMLRSFHYAAASAGLTADAAEAWRSAAHQAFLDAYLAKAAPAGFLPKTTPQRQALLDLYVLEKAIYELDYELNHRPDWVSIPLQGVLMACR